jgi:peptidyl-prolyl cis-trans isomerase D
MILPIIIIVLFFFVAMIVLQWGLDLNRRGPGMAANVAGSVNGDEISWQVFSQTYSDLIQNERASRGQDYEIPEDRARELEDEAWSQIVSQRLLWQQASEMNIVVSDDDVYQFLKASPPTYLRSAPELQTDGQFDYQKYLALMGDPSAGQLWAQIEPVVREDIRRYKLQATVTGTAHVTEQEVRNAFMASRERVIVGMVNARWTQFIGTYAEPTEQELKDWFEANGDKYQVGERVVLDIVKVIKEASEFDREVARAQVQEIYDSVTTGSDFAEFARIFSDDPGSVAAGGDLGWFAQGRMVKEFDSAVFAMDSGQIAGPIETAFGYHIIENHGFREESNVREVHASHILVKAEPSAETLNEGWQKLEMIRELADDAGFEATVEEEGLTVHTTGPLEEDGYVSYIGSGGPVLEWAFDASIGETSEVFDLPNVYCILRVSEKLPPGTANFEQVRPDVERDRRNEVLSQVSRDTIQMVYDEIGQGASLKNAAEKFGLTYEEMPAFSRNSSVAKISSDPAVIGAAFGLAETGALTKPLDYGTGSVILELLAKESPDLTSYNQDRDSVYDAVLQQKKQQAFNNWYTQLVEDADIQSNFALRRR